MAGDALERARAVRLMVFDVDGVLTDGRLYYSESGEELKAFHVRDGHGIRMLMASGVRVALLTARSSGALTHRARNLGITQVLQGASDKSAGLDALLAHAGLRDGDCGYMGDDLPDVRAMRRCAFAAAPHEAPEIVTRHAHHVCRAPAGAGAARETCELVMRAQGKLEAALAECLK